jgi:hypothetical protein
MEMIVVLLVLDTLRLAHPAPLRDAARFLHVSPAHVVAICKAKRNLNCQLVGRRWFVSRGSLAEYRWRVQGKDNW